MQTNFHLVTITPGMIDSTKHFFDTFGHTETEISARWIVRLAQDKGHWGPFTVSELQDFYESKGRSEEFYFNKLADLTKGWLTVEGNVSFYGGEDTATFAPTADFILRCHKASPKK